MKRIPRAVYTKELRPVLGDVQDVGAGLPCPNWEIM